MHVVDAEEEDPAYVDRLLNGALRESIAGRRKFAMMAFILVEAREPRVGVADVPGSPEATVERGISAEALSSCFRSARLGGL